MQISLTGLRRRAGVRIRTGLVIAAAAAAVMASGLEPPVMPMAAGAAAAAHTTVERNDTPSSTGGTTCVPSGNGATCTGTYINQNAWDWWLNNGQGGQNIDPNTGLPIGGGTLSNAPSVTVDQTQNLTNQMVKVSWANFTPSFTGSDTPGYQWQNTYYALDVLQCDNPNPPSDPAYVQNHCNYLFAGARNAGSPPTAVENFTQSGASTQYGDCSLVPNDPTCGTGFTTLQIQTSVENSALGCDNSHACSIVVLPLWGGNWFGLDSTSTPDQVASACADHTQDLGYAASAAIDGSTPGSNPCSWAWRIVVPISFAPTPTQACPLKGQKFYSEGAPALERVMNQWRPAWCVDSQNPLDFGYDSGVDELQARLDFLSATSSFSSGTDVAWVTDPASSSQTAGSTRQFTYAPVANTGISIAYFVDDQKTGEPITDLKLNARLVAKLLTQSYSLEFNQCKPGQTTESDLCDNGVAGNPATIFQDPEFLALNHQYSQSDFNVAGAQGGDFLPIVNGKNSDLTYELTRWIAADPEARAFLQGQPDQYGMHVNTYYQKQESFPVTNFVSLDPGYTVPLKDWESPNPPPNFNQDNPYNKTMQTTWTPVNGPDLVAADLANWTDTGEQKVPICPDGVEASAQDPCPTPNNPADPPQQFGFRTMFAIMDQGTASAFRFPTAQLVNPANNAVGPTTDSMSAALGAMKTNPDKVTQYQDFQDTSPNAYPLTEVEYAMVPTCGLDKSTAQAISQMLTDVAQSQQYGVQPGQVPPFGGYMTLTDAQKAQTSAAAAAVSAQTCQGTPPDHTVAGGTPSSGSGNGNGNGNGSSNASGSGSGNNAGGSTPGGTPSGNSLPGSAGSKLPSSAPSSGGAEQPVGLGTKSGDTGGIGDVLLPVALAIGALFAIGGPLAYAAGTNGVSVPGRRRRPGPSGGTGTGGDPAGGGDD